MISGKVSPSEDIEESTIEVYTQKNVPKSVVSDTIEILTNAFSGNETYFPECCVDWVYGYDEKSRTNKTELFTKLDAGISEHRKQFFTFSMTFVTHMSLKKGGSILVARQNDVIQGVLVSNPVPKRSKNWFSKQWDKLHDLYLSIRIYYSDLKVSGDVFTKEIQRRSEKTDEAFQKLHEKIDQPHIYLAAIGVKPEVRGKGIGKLLMNYIASIADKEHKELYLECAGERNRNMYARFGYEVVGKQKLESPTPETYPNFDLDNGITAMVRTPSK